MKVLTCRRDFLKGTCALGACVVGGLPALADGDERLTIGILSDIHVESETSAAKFERALRRFRDLRVDGVLICGDLADHGILEELQLVADAWFRVFPDDKGLDGKPVVRLFHYGDHDGGGYAHTKGFKGSGEKLMARYNLTYEEVCAHSIAANRAGVWEKCFKEKWEPIFHRRVKGYDFVLANYTSENSNQGNSTPGLAERLQGLRLDPSRPFFYSQHRVYRGTVGGLMAWGQEDGSAGEILSKYPNCLAFCGHGHLTATDERAIWQGAFSAIEVPSLAYVGLEGDHENYAVSELRVKAGFPRQMAPIDNRSANQGLLMKVYADAIRIERLDLVENEPLGEPWQIPLDTTKRPYEPNARRRRAVAPQFPKGSEAKVFINPANEKLTVTFPIANPTATTPRAYDYEAVAIAHRIGLEASVVRHQVFSPKIYAPVSKDTGMARCVFGLAEFPNAARKTKLEYRAVVWPRDAFGLRGEPLVSEFVPPPAELKK